MVVELLKEKRKQSDLKKLKEFKSKDLEKQGDNMPGMMKRPMYKDGKKVLKPVPKGNKGLKKLPKKVRNKMGFMKNGGKVK
jgi:hypothetical protein